MNKIGRSDHGAGVNRTVISVGSIERSENAAVIVPVAAPGRTRVRPPATVWDRVKRNRPALFGLVVMAIVIGVALLAPWIAPYDPARQFTDGLSLEGRPLAPSSRFWLGTDLLGRDLLTRLLYGARISLLIGLLANGAALTIGTFFGAVAGYFRGWVSTAFMRLTDMMMAFPALILAIALAAILRPSMWIVALVIAMVNWVWIARIIYSQVLSVGQREFIEAARALGVPTYRIFWKHLFPHLLPILLVWGTLGISTTVMFEASLSFLGVGVRPPTPSWGGTINESQSYFLEAPWLVAFPGAAILLTSLAFNLVGDALRDAIDPQLRGR
ncbi:MAG: ABC transporter permease [Bacillati bacterium ANGP1]|uniref:ABC transporter permease n=1 Tax=Candidatus Segetimicrobium genomatis TaxID=2569760 RepID=A0A537LDK7_9BACT|nr:MAG: ABC transporter permease [Terrabacteria group bacterium ANGP1]